MGVFLEQIEERAEELSHFLLAATLALEKGMILLFAILPGLHFINERADELDLVHLRFDDFIDYF